MSDTPHSPRLDSLEAELASLRRSNRRWHRAALFVALIAGLGYALPTRAVKARPEIVASSPDGSGEAVLTGDGLVLSVGGERRAVFGPEGIHFERGGKTRMRVDVLEDYTGMTLHDASGSVALTMGSDRSGTSVRIFSTVNKQLRVEMTDRLLDAGSGVRVYDAGGSPRATIYTERRGESGFEITDKNRQPRIDIFASEAGSAVMRATDSGASAVAEVSLIPQSDARVRKTGVMPDEIAEDEPMVPMVYLSDGGNQELSSPTDL